MTIIDKLRVLESKATERPWAFSPYGDENKYGVGVVMDGQDNAVEGLDDSEDGIVVESVAPEVEGHANASLIAAMRNALPALLRVAEAAKEYRAAQRGDYPGEYCAARKAELDAALEALEVQDGR